MLFAHGELRYDPAFVRLHLCFGKRIELQVVERAHCTYDTRWLPSRPTEGSGRLLFHVYLEGDVEVSGVYVPSPFVLFESEKHYWGTKERRPSPLRAGGARFLKIELALPASDASLPPPDQPTVLSPAGDLIEASHALVEAMDDHERAPDRERAVIAWLRTLVEQGLVGTATLASVTEVESSGVARVWRAFAPSLSTIDLGVTLGLLSSRAGITARQIARNVDELLFRSGHPLGFRRLITDWRLRLAVMFLSAPHAEVDEVAKLVGYASTESMAASFREAGLLPPRELKAAVSEPILPVTRG